jgi:hypothetical protein
MLYGIGDERIASDMDLSPMGKKKLTKFDDSTEDLGFEHRGYLAAHVWSEDAA